ncbi:MAG: thiol:disulfide interchange protein DsbA/DsbL [Woeseiaceae bacterium]|nr:thiol:disulfide interchange protein DsbA/DsbL [Woeseiaceae bacterium]
MKKLYLALGAVALFGVGILIAMSLSRDETPQPVAEAAVEEAAEAVGTIAEAEDPTTPATEETLEVVEESAAVEEASDDEPIVLAMADTNEVAAREWKFREGQHYFRMVPTQPTVGGADKIEVAELFMYSCPHCFTLEPYIEQWKADLDPGVRFVRIPAQWNRLAVLHAQIYYTHEILARNGTLENGQGLHEAMFEEFHRRGNRLTSEDAIMRVFARYGVSADDFRKTWDSFEVNQKMRVGADLGRRYNVTSVPTVVVNGKYRTSAGAAGGYDELLELIDELTVREGLR